MTETVTETVSIVQLEDVRQTEDPLPIETIKLAEMHEDKHYVLVMITDWWGEQAGAGIDYFDIVRIFPPANSEKTECSKKTAKCPPIPQFCPTENCISDKVWWTEKNFPGYYQKGCSTIGKDSLFEDKAKCVKKEAIKDLTPPYIIDTANDAMMDECTFWSAEKPCEAEVLTISETPETEILVADTFKLNKDDCSDEEFKIEIINKDDGKASGEFLSYLDSTNSSVEVGDDEQCFVVQHGLCGPDSVTFKTGNDFFLTFCDGVIMLKQEFDYCGYDIYKYRRIS